MRVAIVNVGTILSGESAEPLVDGDAVVISDGRIAEVGTVESAVVEACDVVIDGQQATIGPGLIDSHVHVAFGDWTPRQHVLGWLDSYVHGGVTTVVSAGEAHIPGRPTTPEGTKALAVAAHQSFENYRPGGMRVHGGSALLTPGLDESDFVELRRAGVWLCKAGFGAVSSPDDYQPLVAKAKKCGLVTTVHTGGSSIPGSVPISGQHLLRINPHVSFHCNGGPVAIADRDFEMILDESDIAIQLCSAGNLRTALLLAGLAAQRDAMDRLCIGTDTPTGSGIMPLGLWYTISHLSAVGGIDPAQAMCLATANNARHFGLSTGSLRPGNDADLVLFDAAHGATTADALSSIRAGDIPGIGAVVSGGVPRFVGASRNTPPPARRPRLIRNSVPFDFTVYRH